MVNELAREIIKARISDSLCYTMYYSIKYTLMPNILNFCVSVFFHFGYFNYCQVFRWGLKLILVQNYSHDPILQ